jgi:cephalosporin-C deacetylase
LKFEILLKGSPMPSIDMPLSDLRQYKPTITAQHDFNPFWKRSLEALRREPLSVNLSVRPMPLKDINVYDVNYLGDGDALITGQLIVPAGAKGAPGILEFHGYNGRRPHITHVLHWAAMGAVVLTVDVRGQQGGASDNAIYPGPRYAGFMTAGIEDPNAY